MTKTKKIWIGAGTLAGAAVLTVGGVATAFAGGSGGDEENDKDTPLTGTTLTQASDAALKAAGGGKVTESEASDEPGSAYEVEVLLDNGQEIEVQLDRSFAVVSQETEAVDDADDPDDEADEAAPN
ncbi:hypothetical protein GCM10027020_33070 [Nocardioides salsibiostraticola]